MSEIRGEMNESREQAVLEAAIGRALERPPHARVPEGFAARVAKSLPVGAARRPIWSAGKAVAGVAVVVLAAALFVLAPHAGPSFSNLAFDLELMVLAELGAVAWVLARMQDGRL
jgi:hypothetical protein